jgi:hypothetical protein
MKTADWFPAPFAGYGESRNCLTMIKAVVRKNRTFCDGGAM